MWKNYRTRLIVGLLGIALVSGSAGAAHAAKETSAVPDKVKVKIVNDKGRKIGTAGAHLNPYQKQHGFNNPHGFHAGDLLNIEVGPDGTVETDLVSPTVTLKRGEPNSLLRDGGTSLMIHEKEDDYVTDPSGNSGSRIACGPIL